MSKHEGGDGGTMKEPGNWKGDKGAPTKPIPKQDKPKDKEPIKDHIIDKDK